MINQAYDKYDSLHTKIVLVICICTVMFIGSTCYQAFAQDENPGNSNATQSEQPNTMTTASNFLEYYNSTYGIKIHFPSDWVYKESNASNNSVQTIVSFDPSYLVPRFHRTL